MSRYGGHPKDFQKCPTTGMYHLELGRRLHWHTDGAQDFMSEELAQFLATSGLLGDSPVQPDSDRKDTPLVPISVSSRSAVNSQKVIERARRSSRAAIAAASNCKGKSNGRR
jgi:hypothetical protein